MSKFDCLPPPRRKRPALVAFLAVFGGLAIVGMYAPFLPSAERKGELNVLAWGLAISSLGLLGRVFWHERERVAAASERVGNVVAMVALPVFVCLFSNDIASSAVPYLMHQVSSKDDAVAVFEVKKRHYAVNEIEEIVRGYCVDVAGNASFTGDRICGMKHRTWKATEPGDYLMVTGRSSTWGFRYGVSRRVRVQRSTEHQNAGTTGTGGPRERTVAPE